jgi:pimeloyl-ACP methyl ester carboxylesterase
MRLAALLVVVSASGLLAQRTVTLPVGDGTAETQADVYGSGERGVVLAHGGSFNKESWKKQAEALASAGFTVAAVRFRGDGFSPDGSPGAFGSTADNATDVLAAVAYLRRSGVKEVYAVGGSMGGDAVGEANVRAPGSIARIVLLGSTGGDEPEKLSGRKLFIVAREDANQAGLRLPGILKHYARASEPKKLILLEGSAHAQFLFDTAAGPRVMREIIEFLSAP